MDFAKVYITVLRVLQHNTKKRTSFIVRLNVYIYIPVYYTKYIIYYIILYYSKIDSIYIYTLYVYWIACVSTILQLAFAGTNSIKLPGHQATWEPDQCRERDKAGEPCWILEGRNCYVYIHVFFKLLLLFIIIVIMHIYNIYIYTYVYMQVLRSFVCAPLVLVISVVLLHHNVLGYLIFCFFFEGSSESKTPTSVI